MKLYQLIVLIVLCIGTAALASEESNVQELVPLPHPIKVVMAHQDELKITPDQMASMKKDVVGFFPPRMLPMMIEAKELEVSLLEKIMVQGQTKEALAGEIDELAAVKRKLIDTHIDSLNTLKGILTDEQWTALLVILEDLKTD